MTDHSDLIAELRADLAKMADDERRFWTAKLAPLLEALSSQSLSLSEAREDRDSWRRVAERCESEKQAAHATIRRMDREASEANALYLKMSAERDAAREEIERLKGLVAGIRETPQEPWQDIATAPKDGLPFEVQYDDGTTERDVYWAPERYCILGAPQGCKGPGCMSSDVGLPVDPILWRAQS